MCIHGAPVEVGGQLEDVGPLVPPLGSRAPTQVTSLGSRHQVISQAHPNEVCY